MARPQKRSRGGLFRDLTPRTAQSQSASGRAQGSSGFGLRRFLGGGMGPADGQMCVHKSLRVWGARKRRHTL